jgi:uncharacterized protein (TIGR03000 family)
MRFLLLSTVVAGSALGLLLAAPAAAQAKPLRARITVRVPADARVTIDGNPTRAKSELRRFVTPPLEPGKPFHYTFKAEFVRGGKTITVQERVTVRAGRETVVGLGLPAGPNYSGRGAVNYGAYGGPSSRAAGSTTTTIYRGSNNPRLSFEQSWDAGTPPGFERYGYNP